MEDRISEFRPSREGASALPIRAHPEDGPSLSVMKEMNVE
ncbi:hypothetical protein ACP_2668 [Acidobacterium capsulatum ATCC 51196]|uniref:Uncharacterized protein n=1 Tax=Acidobacterium capsulatum (strain ATCC 51196 / DSM 11244 / BCRC 80197 / JCM 7670 / NBRC 15755 / NCIMB 13165 / 161) TaxID=240015 RepID=C1F2K9_ACIC5|nr:hypothetical protein ACP_2668 [Acidobacterium capsulatum ATCC 51196]